MSTELSPDFLPSNSDRVIVIGTLGSGKSTLAAQLSGILSIPSVEMDALLWEPNWTHAPLDVFRNRVSDAASGDSWVLAGNYGRVKDILLPRATAVIWLDYRLNVILWRLLWRTIKRVITREVIWGGNRERFRDQFLSRESIFLEMLESHRKRVKTIPQELEGPDHTHVKILRLCSPRSTRDWIKKLNKETNRRAK